MATLKDRLDEFKRTFESGAPPYNAAREGIAALHRATDELKASGIDNAVLKVGDRAPDFSLFNQDHVNADYTIRPELSDTVNLLRELRNSQSHKC